MLLHLRQYQPEDLLAALSLWNHTYPVDELDDPSFAAVIHDTRNASRTINLIAMADSQIVGFMAIAIAKSFDDSVTAYLRALAVEPEFMDRIVPLMLNNVQTRLKLQRVTVLDLCRFRSGAIFFPGLDPYYTKMMTALRGFGFAPDETLYDAHVNLSSYTLNEFQIQTIKHVSDTGVKISQFTSAYSSAMAAFIQQANLGDWFAPGWEEQLSASKAIVVRDGAAIIGYAQYRWDGNGVLFGPIAVLPERRSQGIGSALLAIIMNRMKQSGVHTMAAKWALPISYYQKNGWQIAREYVALVKKL